MPEQEEGIAVQEERRLAVLRAIVADYVETREPVGSKTLVERHRLGVSPATIRNDMAALEEEGLIAQPHTSAGRVPTDAGYRLFVDRLGSIKPMSSGERKAISRFLDGAVDLDDVVQRSVRLLAQLTQQVAIVQYPTLTGSTVRHVELVELASTRLLLVLILSTGRVEQRLVEVEPDADGSGLAEDDLVRLRAELLTLVAGRNIVEAQAALEALLPSGGVPQEPAATADVVRCRAAAVLADAMRDHRSDERVVVGGTANLTRFGGSFESSIKPLLEALEEHVVLLQLLGEAATSPALTVRIGAEGPVEELSSTSVVASGYGPGADSLAALGIVGPTRMDYPGTMAAVRTVARYVSGILDDS